MRADQQAQASQSPGFYRHIGLYAYRCQALHAYHAQPPCPIEQWEQLEQLRALYYGMSIQVVKTDVLLLLVSTRQRIWRALEPLLKIGLALKTSLRDGAKLLACDHF